MLKRVSLRWQVVALALASVVAAQAIGFGLLLVWPPPDSPRMTVAEAARGFIDSPDAVRAAGLTRRRVEGEPFGPGRGLAVLIGRRLATQLGTPPDRVRIRMVAETSSNPAPPPPLLTRETSFSYTVRRRSDGVFRPLGADPLADAVFSQLPLASFEAAVQGPDGRWTVVAPHEPILSPWRLRVLLAFGLSAALLAPVALWSARRLTRPVRVLAEAAERLGADPQAPPLAETGPPEVRAAAASFNRMQARLRANLEGRTAMVAAIAHDLRTPLTGLRLRAEAAPPAERDRMAADIARMEAMIAQVMAFVRGEQVREPRERLDLRSLAAACVAEAVERGGLAELAPGAPVFAWVEPVNLRRALSNLVENAVAYSHGARVAVRLDGAGVVVSVSDEGPGLPPAELERVFEPFARGERSRSRDTGGVGLGLASARVIVRAHGGEITLRNRPGGGLIAEVVLPLADAEAPDASGQERAR